MLFIYTDNESYVDVRVIDEDDVEAHDWGEGESYFTLTDKSLMDYDGNCYRITLDNVGEEMMSTIDGVDITELFEGILFAG